MDAPQRIGMSAFLIVSFLVFTDFQAQASVRFMEGGDDSDLSGAPYVQTRSVSRDLEPDAMESAPGQSPMVLEVVRLIKGQPTLVEGLNFTFGSGFSWWDGGSATSETDGFYTYITCIPGTRITGTAELEAERFSINNGSRPYRIKFETECGGALRLIFSEDSNGGQALGIWQIASTAQKKLEAAVGLGFWHNSIAFTWPASADYYSWGSVNITRGDHWDVVGHELGHAIYDQADIGAFGGGEHYIDRCYSGALALSEGWASYFSAWLSVSTEDEDAHFEYMVPRRAPIRFENVPEDVCVGSGSEWRVNAFLWDFIDGHDDGESTNEGFAKVWKALSHTKSRDIGAAAERLAAAGFDQGIINALWTLNFREPPAQRWQ